MKILLAMGLLIPLSSMACAKDSAQAYLRQVRAQVSAIDSCSDKGCIEEKVRISEKLLCEAQKQCDSLTAELNYPCDQHMNLDHESANSLHTLAPLHLEGLLTNAQKVLKN